MHWCVFLFPCVLYKTIYLFYLPIPTYCPITISLSFSLSFSRSHSLSLSLSLSLLHVPGLTMVDFYSSCSDLEGVKCGDLCMSYKSIFQDIRAAIDHIHTEVSGSIPIRYNTFCLLVLLHICKPFLCLCLIQIRSVLVFFSHSVFILPCIYNYYCLYPFCMSSSDCITTFLERYCNQLHLCVSCQGNSKHFMDKFLINFSGEIRSCPRQK